MNRKGQWFAVLLVLSTSASAVTEVHPVIPFKIQQLTEGWTTATGTWVSTDPNRLAPVPINTVQIDCRKTFKTCTVAQANLDSGDGLVVTQISYKLIDWKDEKITAVSEMVFCDRETLVIDLRKKEVSKTYVSNGVINCPPGLEMTLNGGPLTWKLVDPPNERAP
jgi:hypothetical protein